MRIASILKRHELYLVVIIVLLSILITSINHHFATLENFLDLLKISSFTGVLAVGVFVVLLSGGIDLSFTAIATVAMYLMGSYILSFGGNIVVALFILAGVGIVLGAINGFIIHKLEIAAIIVTLGTLSIFYGALMVIAGGRDIYNLPQWFREFAKINLVSWKNVGGSTYGVSIFLVIWAVVLVVTWLILRYTSVGRGVLAIGGSPLAASRAGYRLGRIQLFVYCYIGLLSGLGSVIHVGLVDQIAPHSIVGKELVVIAAVVLGGASLSGGKGSVLGTFLGVLLFAIIGNGLTFTRVTSYWQDGVTGVVLLVSILIAAFRERQREKSLVRVNVEESGAKV
jgi:simple sugar transport system permease protein